MKKSLYSIYDSVAQVFNNPFTDINDGSAIRSFCQSVSEQPHKNDYVLFKLADFTDNDGEVIPLQTPLKLRSGFDVQAAEVIKMPTHLEEQAQ
jgi:hypothetical protein